MPLTESITFKTKLQRHNRIVVPRHCRWRYKMEAGELLKVSVEPFNSESYREEEFLAKMTCDGRLTIPKLTIEILQQREEKNLTGAILEITISPAGGSNDALPAESAEKKMLGKIKDIRKNLGNTTS
jgi:bifunctional DNA-binding transcriptional regulator/antitoxin component of YhaV-PrlF toxin-antitoxin module